MKSQSSPRNQQLVSDPKQIEIVTYESTYFDDQGVECSKESAIAKIDKGSDGSTKYYVMKDGTQLVDVQRANYSRRNKFKWTMSNVTEKSFTSYIAYLRTKKPVCYNNAVNSMYVRGQ